MRSEKFFSFRISHSSFFFYEKLFSFVEIDVGFGQVRRNETIIVHAEIEVHVNRKFLVSDNFAPCGFVLRLKFAFEKHGNVVVEQIDFRLVDSAFGVTRRAKQAPPIRVAAAP